MSDSKGPAMTVTDDTPVDGISRFAHVCREMFQEIEEANELQEATILRVSLLLKRSTTPQRAPLTLEDLSDEFEQFRVWIKNLGVLASNQASLDYRLREAQDVKDGIVSLLKGLQADLGAILFLIEHDRATEKNEGDGSSGDSDSSSDGPDVQDDFGRSAYELQARLQRVVSTINKLMQIAGVIRASNPAARMTKAANYVHYENGVNMTEQFEDEYLPLLLERRYKVKATLVDRLTKAMSLRRRKFQYQAKHQQRLAYPGVNQFDSFRMNASSAHRRLIPMGTSSRQQQSATSSLPSTNAVGSNLLTVATTFKKLQIKKTAPSTIVSASAKYSVNKLDIPPPPWKPARATHFQCPYCCILMRERDFLVGKGSFSKQLWAKHVLADLQPYICLEDECPTPHIFLETQEEWLNHQKWQHSMEWWCEGDDIGHDPSKFDTSDQYIEHAQQVHDETYESAAKQASIAGRPSLLPFNACPFCDFQAEGSTLSGQTGEQQLEDSLSRSLHSQNVLQSHIADELVNIFLIALPERDDIKDIKTDTERPAAKGSTVQALDNVSLSFPDEEGFTSHIDYYALEFDLSIDPYKVKFEEHEINDWEDVWKSPQLQECVRSTYTGFEHDDRLQEMLAISLKDNDAEQEPEFEMWIPYLTLGEEVLVYGRRLPPGTKNYYEIESMEREYPSRPMGLIID